MNWFVVNTSYSGEKLPLKLESQFSLEKDLFGALYLIPWAISQHLIWYGSS